MPAWLSPTRLVTTVTPVANAPTTSRKSSRSRRVVFHGRDHTPAPSSAQTVPGTIGVPRRPVASHCLIGNDPAMPPTGRPAERRLAAVERALRVLDAFLQVRGDAGTTELARLTGINASTVSRTLSTLVDAGYVEHVPDTGRYRLGTHLLALSNHVLARLDLRVARPVAPGVARGGAGRDGDAVDARPSPTRSRSTSCPAGRASSSVARIGRASVAHATATGKVMLAFARCVGRARAGSSGSPSARSSTRPRCAARSTRCGSRAGRGRSASARSI